MTVKQPNRLGRGLGLLAFVVAVLATVSVVSFPIRGRRLSAVFTVFLALALFSHAAFYWWGARFRIRWGAVLYFAVQVVAVFLIGLAPALYPLSVGLYLALGAEAFIVSDGALKEAPLTLGVITLCVIDAWFALGVYRAASLGIVLTMAGVCVFAARAIVDRFFRARELPLASGSSDRAGRRRLDVPSLGRGSVPLTTREREVLRWLARGSRTRHIAESLGISERTVKAHLGSIYQKLGVDSRTAAIASAIEQDLLEPTHKEFETRSRTPLGQQERRRPE